MDREEALKIVDDGDAEGGAGDLAFPFGIKMLKAALGIANPYVHRIIIDAQTGAFPVVYVSHALATDRETMADLVQLLQSVPADRIIALDQAPEQPPGDHVDLVAGIPGWSPVCAYDMGAFVYHTGFFWKALCTNVGHRPDTNSAAWEMSPHPGAWVVTDLVEGAESPP